jgi:hypothetical protein
VKFGTNGNDYDNMEWNNYTDSYTTRFLVDKYVFSISFDKTTTGGYEVGFTNLSSTDYSSAGQKIFSYALSIVLYFVKENDPEYIRFAGSSRQHDRIYTRLIDSEYIQSYIKKLGYESKIEVVKWPTFIIKKKTNE